MPQCVELEITAAPQYGHGLVDGALERFWDEEKSSTFINNHDTFERANGIRARVDGQAAALYGQYPPLVNASRAPSTCSTA